MHIMHIMSLSAMANIMSVMASLAASSDSSLAAAVASASFPTNVISVPLIPRHVQHQRRLRLQEEQGVAQHQHEDERELSEHFAQQVGALYQGYGTHYVDLWCGTPPQRQTVIVDTGSSTTAFPCTGCDDCGVPDYHIDGLFRQDESSTFHATSCTGDGCVLESHSHCSASTDQCQVSAGYAEGSGWDAIEATDRCYIGGLHAGPSIEAADQSGNNADMDDLDPQSAGQHAIDLVFACQHEITGLFKTQLADGIMGMSNNRGGHSYWQQLFQNTDPQNRKNQFALCFARQPTAAREGTEAGAMTLGGVDPRLHYKNTDIIPYTSNESDSGRESYFSIKIRAVHLRDGAAGESANSSFADNPSQGVVKLDVAESKINTGGIIVDSGTTNTYFNRALQSAFLEEFERMTSRTYNSKQKYVLTPEELKSLPTILIQLHGGSDNTYPEGTDPNQIVGLAGDVDPEHPYDVIVAFPPSHYMEYYAHDNYYKTAFHLDRSRGSVLGANAMMGHDVVFDVDNSRIGFVESDCDLSRVLDDNDLPSVFDTPAEVKSGHISKGGDGSNNGDTINDSDKNGDTDNDGGKDIEENNDEGEQRKNQNPEEDEEFPTNKKVQDSDKENHKEQLNKGTGSSAKSGDESSSPTAADKKTTGKKNHSQSFFEECNGACKGSLVAGGAMLFCLLYCVTRAVCCNDRHQYVPALNDDGGLELAGFDGEFPGYKDDEAFQDDTDDVDLDNGDLDDDDDLSDDE